MRSHRGLTLHTVCSCQCNDVEMVLPVCAASQHVGGCHSELHQRLNYKNEFISACYFHVTTLSMYMMFKVSTQQCLHELRERLSWFNMFTGINPAESGYELLFCSARDAVAMQIVMQTSICQCSSLWREQRLSSTSNSMKHHKVCLSSASDSMEHHKVCMHG